MLYSVMAFLLAGCSIQMEQLLCHSLVQQYLQQLYCFLKLYLK